MQRRSYSPHSISNLSRDVRQLKEFLSKRRGSPVPSDAVTPAAVAAYRLGQTRRVAPSTFERSYYGLQNFFRTRERFRGLPNRMARMKPPKLPAYLSRRERGFDSRWDHHGFLYICEVLIDRVDQHRAARIGPPRELQIALRF